MKLLFLYTELAEYFLSCITCLSETAGMQIHVVNWEVNKEAPFHFSYSEKIKFYKRSDFNSDSLVELATLISPDLIYCSGWVDKEYLLICKLFHSKIPVVVGFDNKWKGSINQHLGSIFNKITIQKYFSHCWIPGKPQMEFAKRLGFDKQHILTGLYSCQYEMFHRLYLKYREAKKNKYPRKLIFVGRYYQFKGIEDLWSAFIQLQDENPNDWELWCLGTGNVYPMRHSKLKHFGFIQPADLSKYVAETGVFIMPSRFEPWGVATHEFAAAGFPLICSNEVGSASMFLQENENGFLFKAGNVSELKKVLNKIMSMPDEQLFAMGEKSAKLAEQITPDKWSDVLLSIVNKNTRIS